MRITVTFRHMESSEALKAYAEEKTERLKKYLLEAIEVHWVLSVEKIRHIADASITSNGVVMKAEGDTEDMYSAIDLVIDKLEKQVRKHKEKVKDHKSHNDAGASIRYTAEGVAIGNPVRRKVVKKDNQFLKPMSVDEASMQMDIIDNHFLVFKDSSTGGVSVIYRLENGDYGLIEPHSR